MRRTVAAILIMGFGMMAEGAVTTADFGRTPDGATVEVYTLMSAGVEARVITYGARLISVKTPDRTGRTADVVLGYDTLPE
jgi:aldose 1-epimerase